MMSFGLNNASTTFIGLMNDIFRPYLDKSVIMFLYDILIYSKTLIDHKKHLREVLKVLRENSLYVKASKCEFDKSEVDYLSHRITTQWIQVISEKIQAI